MHAAGGMGRDKMRNQGIVVVSYELLRLSLGLPDDAEIIAIGQDFEDQTKSVFRILVQHSNLLEVGKGALSPIVRPIRSLDGAGNFFFQWGRE